MDKYSYSINTSIGGIIRETNLVSFNKAREMVSWEWRNSNIKSFAIYNNGELIMLRIRGLGTIRENCAQYTNC